MGLLPTAWNKQHRCCDHDAIVDYGYGAGAPSTSCHKAIDATGQHNVVNNNNNNNNNGDTSNNNAVSNQYVLNVAFFSFVGFMLVQASFAIFAKSEAMLADTEAMSIDAITYLFNMCAERIKQTPVLINHAHLQLPHHHTLTEQLIDHRRELRRLYLELIPPTISVTALLLVTIYTTQDSMQTLAQSWKWNAAHDNTVGSETSTSNDHYHPTILTTTVVDDTFDAVNDDDADDDDDVNVSIMLIFSALNLIIDIMNVMCFARAHSIFSITQFRRGSVALVADASDNIDDEGSTESTTNGTTDEATKPIPSVKHDSHESTPLLPTTLTPLPLNANKRLAMNLNMCSAWTVCWPCSNSFHCFVCVCLFIFCCSLPSCENKCNTDFFPLL
jgi:hypothetical protein